MTPPIAPPASEDELLIRARAIAGMTLRDVARSRGHRAPNNLLHAKGWAGQLIEALLGATASSKSEPDFESLGIELKTLPVRRDGQPTESTHVCAVPLTDTAGLTWRQSCVYRKLARVLWIPVEADAGVALPNRRIGSALLWSPSADEEAGLRADWEELMDMVCLGELDRITAHHGTWLQIRPKAANARALRWGVGESGDRVPTLPRGFYLRPTFTTSILRRHYLIAR